MTTTVKEAASSMTYSHDGSRLEVHVPFPEEPSGEIRIVDANGTVKGKLKVNRDLAAAVCCGLELESTTKVMKSKKR